MGFGVKGTIMENPKGKRMGYEMGTRVIRKEYGYDSRQCYHLM